MLYPILGGHCQVFIDPMELQNSNFLEENGPQFLVLTTDFITIFTNFNVASNLNSLCT